MKIICVFIAIVAIVYAAPQADKDAVVIKNELDNIGVDGFKWAYETSNGIQAQEQGQIANVGTDNELLSVRGSYSYKGADGVVYTVTYVADENGFQPEGAHIPK